MDKLPVGTHFILGDIEYKIHDNRRAVAISDHSIVIFVRKRSVPRREFKASHQCLELDRPGDEIFAPGTRALVPVYTPYMKGEGDQWVPMVKPGPIPKPVQVRLLDHGVSVTSVTSYHSTELSSLGMHDLH